MVVLVLLLPNENVNFLSSDASEAGGGSLSDTGADALGDTTSADDCEFASEISLDLATSELREFKVASWI